MTYITAQRFLLESVLLFLVVVLPVSVHAGVFASLLAVLDEEKTEIEEFTLDTNVQTLPLLKASSHIDPSLAHGGGDILVKEGTLVPSGDVSEEDRIINTKTINGEISVYTVQSGDTLSQIAEMFDVSAKTVLWANEIKNGVIHPGDTLVILPITGVRHVVKSGDTIGSIAKKYSGDVDDILAYNQLDSIDSISIGDTVVIPGGEVIAPKRTYVTPTRTSGGSVVASGSGSSGFVHPLPGAIRTQGIHGYNGVDLAAPMGTPIRAAASGIVIVAKNSGWNGGYGKYAVIKHPNGTQTLYSHNSSTIVSVGQKVVAGQVIGYVGSTGRSTGPHVHFEVRGARNPF